MRRLLSVPSPRLASASHGASDRWATRLSLAILAGWIASALLAPLIGPSEQERTLLERTETTSISLLPPWSSGWLVEPAVTHEAADEPADQRILFAPNGQTLAGTPLLHKRFWLGTDRIGQDLLVTIAKGARTSLIVGLLAALVATTAGVGVGALAGLSTPLVDNLLMRLVDAMLAFPMLLLVLLLDLLFEPSLLALIIILGSAQWMSVARIVRAEMLRLRTAPFVLAARGVGAGGLGLFVRHLLPNAAAPILVSGLLLVGDSILLESAVSFLGFGTASDLSSWGRLVDAGRPLLADAWWISTFPGLAIMLVVVALNLVGDTYNQRSMLNSRAARS